MGLLARTLLGSVLDITCSELSGARLYTCGNETENVYLCTSYSKDAVYTFVIHA